MISPEDVLVARKFPKPSDLNIADRTASEKRGHILRQVLTLRVHDIVDKSDRSKRPEDHQRSRAFLWFATESDPPVGSRSRIGKTGLLHLEKHGVERREIAQPHDEIKERLVVRGLAVETGICEQSIEKGTRHLDLKQASLCIGT